MNSYPALGAGFLNPLYSGGMETRADMGKAPYHLIEGRDGGSPKAQNTDSVGETADASKVNTNNNVGYNGNDKNRFSNKSDVEKITSEIVGTNYNKVRPTQEFVNPQKIEDYSNRLKAGEKLSPVEVINIPGKGMYIVEGHHRYVASQRTGIPIEIIVVESQGPIGLPDWSEVHWKEYIDEDQFWGE